MTASGSETARTVRFFDAHIRSDTRHNDDLKNLSYFETQRVLTVAHPARPFERAEDLLAYFEMLLHEERARLQGCGLHAQIALGLSPQARPRRAHYEVWQQLPRLLERDGVGAVGEVGAHEDSVAHWDLLERQAKLAAELALPLIVTTPRALRVTMSYKAMRHLERWQLPPSQVVICNVDARFVDTVLAEGFCATIDAGPMGLGPEVAAEAVACALEAVGDPLERLMLSSGLRAGPADVLSLPKTARALAALGVDEAIVEAVAWSNAVALFGQAGELAPGAS